MPNLIRALFSTTRSRAVRARLDQLLEKGKKKEAFHVASSLCFLLTLILGAITALFVIFAEPLMNVFSPGLHDNRRSRT